MAGEDAAGYARIIQTETGGEQKGVLYTPAGDPIHFVDDGGNKRLAVDVAMSGGAQKVQITDSGGTDIAEVSAGGALHVTMSPVQLSGVAGGKLEDSGGNTNMAIDGSTPVNFTFDCDPVDDLWITYIKILLLPNVLRMDAGSFGSLSGPLTNGCRFAITSGGTEYVIVTAKQTEDLVTIPGDDFRTETGLPANDLLLVSINYGGALKLVGGSSDKVEMRIQDDLTKSGPNEIVLFEATVSATKV
jgi:hypothetical protein